MKTNPLRASVSDDRHSALAYKDYEEEQLAPVSFAEQSQWDAWCDSRARAIVRAAVEIIAVEHAKKDRQYRAQISRLTSEITLLKSGLRPVIERSPLLQAIAKTSHTRK
jgi:hypothetical protein